MKNRMALIGSILIIGLILAACGSKQTTGVKSSISSTGSELTGLTVSEKLAIGTLMLENTNQEVSAEEAAELLPLWKAVKSLSASDTVSTQEMEALYSQIKGSMTSDQIKAIDAMTYTSADVDKLLTDLGVGIATASQSTSKTSSSASGASGSSQGMPGGGPGMQPDAAGMPAGMDAGGFSPQANGTSSTTASAGSSAALPTRGNAFYEALISMLKEKAATASS